ncbi:hypothetical protein ACX6XY_24975 [Streptomyces sp. O3]
MAISRVRRALTIGATSLAAAAACLSVTGLTSAQAVPQPPASAPLAVEADGMPSAVEDFNYPGAAKLLEDRGIALKRGDGHIVLTGITEVNQCTSDPSNIFVESRLGFFCFKSNAKTGYLTMELPKTFNIWTGAQPVEATLTADGKETVVDAAANKMTTVGETGNSGRQSALVELRVNS